MSKRKIKESIEIFVGGSWTRATGFRLHQNGWCTYTLKDGTTGLAQPKNVRSRGATLPLASGPGAPTTLRNEVDHGSPLGVRTDDADRLLPEDTREVLRDLPRLGEVTLALGVIPRRSTEDLDDDRRLATHVAGTPIAPDATNFVARGTGVEFRDGTLDNRSELRIVDIDGTSSMKLLPGNTGSDVDARRANGSEHSSNVALRKLRRREGEPPRMGRFWLYFEETEEGFSIETSWLPPEAVRALGGTRKRNGSIIVTCTDDNFSSVTTRVLNVLVAHRSTAR